jgi:hypothetical protein
MGWVTGWGLVMVMRWVGEYSSSHVSAASSNTC